MVNLFYKLMFFDKKNIFVGKMSSYRVLNQGFTIILVILLLHAVIPTPTRVQAKTPVFIYDDMLLTSDTSLEIHDSLGHIPGDIIPGYFDTSEYLIGSVAVGIIFLESNGTIDSSTENWNSAREVQVISEIKVESMGYTATHLASMTGQFYVMVWGVSLYLLADSSCSC